MRPTYLITYLQVCVVTKLSISSLIHKSNMLRHSLLFYKYKINTLCATINVRFPTGQTTIVQSDSRSGGGSIIHSDSISYM